MQVCARCFALAAFHRCCFEPIPGPQLRNALPHLIGPRTSLCRTSWAAACRRAGRCLPPSVNCTSTAMHSPARCRQLKSCPPAFKSCTCERLSRQLILAALLDAAPAQPPRLASPQLLLPLGAIKTRFVALLSILPSFWPIHCRSSNTLSGTIPATWLPPNLTLLYAGGNR